MTGYSDTTPLQAKHLVGKFHNFVSLTNGQWDAFSTSDRMRELDMDTIGALSKTRQDWALASQAAAAAASGQLSCSRILCCFRRSCVLTHSLSLSPCLSHSVSLSLCLSLSLSPDDWIRDLTAEGLESNPGPFDSEETKYVEVYSSDGSSHLQSFRAPQRTVAAVINSLRGLGRLDPHQPPTDHDWTTLQDAAGIVTTWEDQVDAGKYKIVATRATAVVVPPAGQRT